MRLLKFFVLLCMTMAFTPLKIEATTPIVKAITSVKAESPVSGDLEKDLFSVASNDMRIDELNKVIEKWTAVPVEESAARFAVTPAEVENRLTALTALQNFYKRLNVAIEKSDSYNVEIKKRESEKGQAKLSLEEKPPYNLSYYENFLQKIEELKAKKENLNESIVRDEKAIKSSAERLDEEGKALRLAQSEVEEAKTPEEKSIKQWGLASAEIKKELWLVTEAYLKTNLGNLYLQRKALDLRLDQIEEVRAYIYGNLAYDKKDFDSGISRYESEINKLKEKISSLSGKVEKAEKNYADAHVRLSAATGQKTIEARQRAFAEADVERDYLHLSLEQAQEMLGVVNEMRDIWGDRYEIIKNPAISTDVLIKEIEDVEGRLGRFEDVLISQQRYQATLHSMSQAIVKELEDEKDKNAIESLKRREKTVDRMVSQNMDYMVSLMNLDTMNRRLLEELKGRMKKVDISEKVTTLWRAKVSELLDTELWQVQGYAVRLEEFVIALFIFLLGIVASRRLAVFIRKWLLMHSKRVDVTGVHAIERCLYYVLLLGSCLIALKIVNVPLTAFAFLGGAIAIGIGFGAQNLFNNLISGFILMIQQPFKINDIVQFDDITATVLEIDSRSTKIRTFDNVDVLVPNSYFLDNRIINWTLSDKIIRGKLDIGVAYGTDAKKVESLLLKVVEEHPMVLPSPVPYVLFVDYGASSLDFTLYFWVDIRQGFPNKVASDMRYTLQRVFKEEEIEVPFPQMDVTLKR